MTLEQLYYFTEVYQQRSITQAANNLYVSRPALSMVIRKLESEFGVTLFTRIPNGVKPTQAGDEFYQSAQIILEEHARLKHNMKNHAALSQPKTIMKIGISEGLMSGYGDEIAEKLISIYPHIYFDFSQIIVSENQEFFKDYHLSIQLTTEESHAERLALFNDEYLITQVSLIPMYVWIANSSPLQKYSIVTLDQLKNYPFCSLKNTYNGINFASMLTRKFGLTNMKPNIELKSSFVQHIEHLGYYTIDQPSNKKGTLFYEQIFKGRAVTLKETDIKFMLQIICKKESYNKYKAFYPLITDILTSH